MLTQLFLLDSVQTLHIKWSFRPKTKKVKWCGGRGRENGGGGVMGGVAFRNENSRLNSQLTWLPGTGPFNCLTTHMMMATTTTRSEKLFQRAAAAATSMSLTIRKGVGKGARGGGVPP